MNRLLNTTIYFLAIVWQTSNAQTKDSSWTYGCIPKLDTLDNRIIHLIIDKMPEFPNGQASMGSFIQENLKYPEHWRGRIYVTFIVDTTGEIRNACILKTDKENNVPSDIEKEILRMINKMPPWTPGQRQGEKVYARVTLPLNFEFK